MRRPLGVIALMRGWRKRATRKQRKWLRINGRSIGDCQAPRVNGKEYR